MRSVDERIVDMQFNNKQFEEGIQTSLKSLENLDRGLNDAGKSGALSGLASSVETIADKFSTLGIMGVTALVNITNSAVEAGKRIVSALTIAPIMQGFSEYELQIGSIQTILANTQGTQEKVSKKAIDEVTKTAEESAAQTKIANESALENLRSTQKNQLKAQQKSAAEALKVVEKKYEAESEALEKAIKAEDDRLNKAHQKKLARYDKEFMAKLKVIDEERYKKIKAIDDEIAAINGLEEAESEAQEAAEETQKLQELTDDVKFAKSSYERMRAEEALTSYKEEIAKKELQKERKKRIDVLNADKDAIQEKYDLAEEKLKSEYEEKQQKENELFNDKLEKLREEQAEKRKLLRSTFQAEKEKISEKSAAEREALQERQAAELKFLNESNKKALENVEIQRQAQLKALNDVANATMTDPSTLEDVTKALDELNKYADDTIYNFAEMSRNIGTFTAAGVDLDTSVKAIKGIANLAAVSGSTSQQASTAMYQLSQALSSGTVRLQDWNSVVNAGMGGQVFQNALIETARAHGIAVDEMIASEGSFRESLKKEWLSADVLTETLSKFTGDLTQDQLKSMGYTEEQIVKIMQMGETAKDAATKIRKITQLYDTLQESAASGWGQTWKILIGDFEEATELLTRVGEVLGGFIDGMSDARNEMLQTWKDNGGREIVIQAISNAFEGLVRIMTAVMNAFKRVFPPLTGQQLVALSKGLQSLTEKFKISDTTADKIERTFAGLFTILGFVADAFKFLLGVVGGVVGVLSPLAGGLLEITATIGDLLVALREGEQAGKVFKKGLEGIRTFLEWVADGVEAAVQKIGHWFGQFGGIDLGPLEIFSDRTKVAFKPITLFLETAKKVFDRLKAVFDWVAPYFFSIAAKCKEALSKIGEVFSSATGVTNIGGFVDIITKILTGGVLIKLSQLLGELKEMTSGSSGFLVNITGILDGVRGSLEAYQSNLKSKTILNIAIAIGVLAAALWVLSTIPMEEMQVGLTGITVLFIELAAVMSVISKSMSGGVKLAAVATAMVLVSTAVLILSAACKNLSGLSWEEMSRGLLGIAGLLAELIVFEKLIGSGKGLIKVGVALIPLATGLLILTAAVKLMSTVPWEGITKSLVAFGAIITGVAFLSKVVKPAEIMALGVAFLALGAGLVGVATAMVIMNAVSWEGLIKGLLGFGTIIAGVALLSKVVNPAAILALSGALLVLGAGLIAMATALVIMNAVSWEGLIKGLLGFGAIIAGVALLSNVVNPVAILALSGALLILGGGLIAIATAMVIMGAVSWEGLVKGLLGFGAVIVGVALLSNVVNPVAILALSGALMAFGIALSIMVPALVVLGSMSLANIGIMLLALVGVIGVFAAAAALLTPVIPSMLALAGAIALLGVGVLALGAGLLLCATAMTAFAVSGTAGAVALTALVSSLVGMIPMVIKNIGEGIVLLVGTLVEAVPGILKIIGMLLEGVINLVITYSPKLMGMLGVLLTEVLALLLEYVPKIADVALKMLVGVLKAIAENIDEIVLAAISIINALLKGITDGIPSIVDAIFGLLEEIARQIGEYIPRLIDLGFEMIMSFLNGMADTIRENVPMMVDTVLDLIDAVVDGIVYALETGIPELKEQMARVAAALWTAFKEFFGIRSPSTLSKDGAGMIIQGIINGLGGGITKVVNKIKDVAKAIWNGFKDFFGIKSPSKLMETEGGQVTSGIQKGLEGGQGSLKTSAINLGKKLFNGIKSAVKDVGSIASNVVNTLGEGLQNGLKTVGDAAKNVGDGILSGIKDVLGINSPAKTMIDIAHHTGDGLVIGLKDMMSPVAKAAGNVGDGAVNSMKDSLSHISDALDADMDLVPTIRPVIDMSDVESGLTSTFSKKQSLNVGKIKADAATVALSARKSETASSGDTTTNNSDNSQVQIINHFTVRNDADVDKINKGLANILTKYDRAKGVKVR